MAYPKWLLKSLLKDCNDCYQEGLTRDVLGAIDSGVEKCGARISRAESTRIDEYIDAVADKNCDVIETMLGCAFVAGQAYIAYVVSRIGSIAKVADAQYPGSVTSLPKVSKQALMCAQSRVIGDRGATEIECINALANYFKHRDEWSGSWEKIGRPSCLTVDVITQIGLQEGSSGNLRTGSEATGNPHYDNSAILASTVAEWYKSLTGLVTSDLRRFGRV